MAFKLRLQIFFVILTVVPLLVGGWIIQRTVLESRKSSIDQRLASGVGTLGAQYAALENAGVDALKDVKGNEDLNAALLNKNKAAVANTPRTPPAATSS